MNVRLTKEQKIKILNAKDVFSIMRQILMRENKIGRAKEHFWVVGLNNGNRILFIELISLGSATSTIVNPPEVFRLAIYKLATQIILVHNHPSGNMKVSKNDTKLTETLKIAGSILGIPVLDHLIISEDDYISVMKKS